MLQPHLNTVRINKIDLLKTSTDPFKRALLPVFFTFNLFLLFLCTNSYTNVLNINHTCTIQRGLEYLQMHGLICYLCVCVCLKATASGLCHTYDECTFEHMKTTTHAHNMQNVCFILHANSKLTYLSTNTFKPFQCFMCFKASTRNLFHFED